PTSASTAPASTSGTTRARIDRDMATRSHLYDRVRVRGRRVDHDRPFLAPGWDPTRPVEPSSCTLMVRSLPQLSRLDSTTSIPPNRPPSSWWPRPARSGPRVEVRNRGLRCWLLAASLHRLCPGTTTAVSTRRITRQRPTVHRVLAGAVLAAQVGWVVRQVRSCRAE